MEIVGIIILIGVVGGWILTVVKNAKEKNVLKNKIKIFENKPTIKISPTYVKLESNLNPRVYKIRDIIIVPQNEKWNPELCMVITCEDIKGNTYNATIDKFVIASESEYNKNLKSELEF